MPGRCLLHLQALNLQGMEAIHLRQLLCPSGAWSLASLEQASAAEVEQQQAEQQAQLGMDLQLGPEAAAACYYHLRPAAEGAGGTLPAAAASLSEAERYFQGSCGGQATASAPSSSREPAGELSGPVDLMVQWEAAGKAGGARVLGYSSVSIRSVRLGPPVHVQLLGPSGGSVVHEFSVAPICTLPLRLRLRNELSAPATVVIEAGRHVTAAGEARTPGVPGGETAFCVSVSARLEGTHRLPPFHVQYCPRGPPPGRPPPPLASPPAAVARCWQWAAQRRRCASMSGPAAPASPCPACGAGQPWRCRCTCRRRRRGSWR